MNFCRTISALVLVCLLPYGAAAQEEPPTPPVSAAGACTIVGPVLGPSDFGVAALGVAVVVSVLAVGTVRPAHAGQNPYEGVLSSATCSPGVAFTAISMGWDLT
jgi:hypothetical protein